MEPQTFTVNDGGRAAAKLFVSFLMLAKQMRELQKALSVAPSPAGQSLLEFLEREFDTQVELLLLPAPK